MTNIIVTGMVSRFPVGGNAWSYLQYVLGLKRLGYDVYYLEDSIDFLCYNLDLNSTDRNFDYCINYLKNLMSSRKINLNKHWALRVGNECFGMSEKRLIEVCKDTELLINVSGSVLLNSWVAERWLENDNLNLLPLERKEYRQIPKKILIDTDPAYTQFKFANDPDLTDYGNKSVTVHDKFFTFGENIGKSDCLVPDLGFKWNKTRQPIVLDLWPPQINSNFDTFTSMMNWSSYEPITYRGETYGQKDIECRKFIKLPKLTNQKIELAMSGGMKPRELVENGWKLVSGIAKKRRDMWAYQRYIQESQAEWSVAKNIYVKTRCGWFSERSACYLASGKPVLLQETGFSKFLPCGKGLIAFKDMDGIIKGIDNINDSYVSHCEKARDIAEEYFNSDLILKNMLQLVGM